MLTAKERWLHVGYALYVRFCGLIVPLQALMRTKFDSVARRLLATAVWLSKLCTFTVDEVGLLWARLNF